MSWLPDESEDDDSIPRHRRHSEEHQAIIAGAAPDVKLPTGSISWSQINLYLTCAQRYYHKYVLRKPQPNSSNLVHGRMLHSTLESMHLYKMEHNAMPPRERHMDEITDAIRTLEEETEVWDVKVPDVSVAEASARTLANIYYDERLPSVRPRAVELKVVSLLRNRIPFLGYIDLVERNPMEPDGIVNPTVDPTTPRMGDIIIDLKMTGKKYAPSQVENGAQLTLYAHVTGVTDVGYDLLIQKKNSEYVAQRATRSLAEKEHVLDMVEDVVRGISAGYFPKTSPESWACSEKWCPYYGECRGRSR